MLNSEDLANFLNNPDGVTNNNLPKAYINWLFFDENFNPIASDATTGNGSGAMSVTGSGDGKSLVQSGIKVPGSGYAFVYVSNTSSTNVYFDNLKIIHERGRILQEHHYYPYGLEIANISSKAFGKLDNYKRYQGEYAEFEEETGWINFDLRSYEPALGRFTKVDPYQQYVNSYMGMGNNPVNVIDRDGGFNIPFFLATTAVGAGIGYLAAPSERKLQGALWGAAGGAAVGALSNEATSGAKGMLIGAGVGFISPYLVEGITGKEIKNKLLWGLGGAFVGAGIGYGIGESLFPGSGIGDSYMRNSSKNFFANFKAFYTGLAGRPGVRVGPVDKSSYYAFSPNVIGEVNIQKIAFKWIKILPKWNLDPRREDGPTGAGMLWRLALQFNPPVIPAYFLLREILQFPIPYVR